MLSRIAESLYWVGRYAERAEDIARILDVHLHHILEDPWVDEDVACRTLLGIMGIPSPPGPLDAARVIDILAFNPSDTCSIVGSLTAARDNARGARDAISSEMWECMNATYHDLATEATNDPDEFWGLSWRTPDIEAAHARLGAAGIIISDIRVGRRPGTRVFTVKDRCARLPTLVLGRS